MIRLGDFLVDQESLDSAYDFYDQVISFTREKELNNYHITAQNKLGRLLRKQGSFDQALLHHYEAMDMARSMGDSSVLASIYNNIGVAFRRKAEDNNALRYHFLALNRAEESDNYRMIAYSYNNIGIIYTYQDNYDEALEYYNNALELAREINNMVSVAINLNSIAWIYTLKNENQQAIEYYMQSLKVNEEIGNEEGMAICYNDIGKIYSSMGRYDHALEYFRKTLDINEKEGDKRYIAQSRLNIGEVYAEIGNYSSALNQLYLALEYALESNSKRLILEVYQKLSTTYERTEEFRRSLEFNKLAGQYRDSVYNEERSRQIAEFRTRFETERKERENLVLEAEKESLDRVVKIQRQVVIVISIFLIILSFLLVYLWIIWRKLLHSKSQISEQNDLLKVNEIKLNEMVATKDKFLKIIAHDLKNHFNVIIGMSELLLELIHDEDVEKRDMLTKAVVETSRNTYQLLENLLVWSTTQTEGIKFAPSKVFFDDVVEVNKRSMKALAGEKDIELNATENCKVFIYADMEMLKTILRNLVSNAIKFSKDGGKVVIDTEQQEDQVIISVSDSGVGIDPDKQGKLFDITQKVSTLGTSKEKGTGLGLILCREFVERHHGKIWVESSPGEGSTFYFSIPITNGQTP